jgi:hypothetical protein
MAMIAAGRNGTPPVPFPRRASVVIRQNDA